MTASHAEEALVRPYAGRITTTPPMRPVPKVLRWVPFVPGSLRWVVAWGNCPAYAVRARQFAYEYAADRRLGVAGHVVSYSQEVGAAKLFGTAEKSAVVRAASYGLAWWLVLEEDLRGIDLQAVLARQRAEWDPPEGNEPTGREALAPVRIDRPGVPR